MAGDFLSAVTPACAPHRESGDRLEGCMSSRPPPRCLLSAAPQCSGDVWACMGGGRRGRGLGRWPANHQRVISVPGRASRQICCLVGSTIAALGQMESEVVMTGLVPVIHVLFAARKMWMRGTEPAHDGYKRAGAALNNRCMLLNCFVLSSRLIYVVPENKRANGR